MCVECWNEVNIKIRDVSFLHLPLLSYKYESSRPKDPWPVRLFYIQFQFYWILMTKTTAKFFFLIIYLHMLQYENVSTGWAFSHRRLACLWGILNIINALFVKKFRIRVFAYRHNKISYMNHCQNKMYYLLFDLNLFGYRYNIKLNLCKIFVSYCFCHKNLFNILFVV